MSDQSSLTAKAKQQNLFYCPARKLRNFQSSEHFYTIVLNTPPGLRVLKPLFHPTMQSTLWSSSDLVLFYLEPRNVKAGCHLQKQSACLSTEAFLKNNVYTGAHGTNSSLKTESHPLHSKALPNFSSQEPTFWNPNETGPVRLSLKKSKQESRLQVKSSSNSTKMPRVTKGTEAGFHHPCTLIINLNVLLVTQLTLSETALTQSPSSRHLVPQSLREQVTARHGSLVMVPTFSFTDTTACKLLLWAPHIPLHLHPRPLGTLESQQGALQNQR